MADVADLLQLRQFVDRILPSGEADWDAFAADWQPLTVKRKTVLTAAGETERYVYFVLDGVQRAYYIGDGNHEATIVFTYPYSFSGVADSFLTQTASPYFFETITASRFLRLPYERVQFLMQHYQHWQKVFFMATAFALKGALLRHVELQCYSNEEKFKTLLSRSPHILQLVPHKYLASYLGMDASNFSKLMNSTGI